MKAQSLASLTILISLLSVSCSDNSGIKLRYEAEKRYYKAQKALTLTTSQPELVTVEKIRDVAHQFRDLSKFCYDALAQLKQSEHLVESREIQNIAYQSTSRLSQLYFSAGMFDSCVSNLQRMIDNIELTESQMREASLSLGQALQSNRQWDSALLIYQQAVLQFFPPLDSTRQIVFSVFNLPTHIFRLAVYVTDSLTSQKYLDEAIRYYHRFISDHPNTKLAIASHANLARLYDDIGRWDLVVSELRALVDSSGKPTTEVRLRIADTYSERLQKHNDAIAIYDSLLAETPETDTLIYPLALFKRGVANIGCKKYAEGREQLVDIKKQNITYYMKNPAIQLAIARSFELEGNWSRAETEYQSLLSNFKGSEESMNAYLHVADRFYKLGRPNEAENWYAEAIRQYDELATRGAGTLVEASALYYKATAYEMRQNWKEAAAILETIFDKFPDSDAGRNAINRAAQISRTKLLDAKAAAALEEKFKIAVAKFRRDWES